MWDTVQHTPGSRAQLSHDMPCVRCGHAPHTFLACDESCGCQPVAVPGSARVA